MIEMTGWTRAVVLDEELAFLVRLVAGESPDRPFEGRPFVRSFEEAMKQGWIGNGRGEIRPGPD